MKDLSVRQPLVSPPVSPPATCATRRQRPYQEPGVHVRAGTRTRNKAQLLSNISPSPFGRCGVN